MSFSFDSDDWARKKALDPQESFVVQAPAGSGKTELLSQRFLVLLAQVNQPEQVLALTFTRKAAAEMRDRIYRALQHAATMPCPEESHRKRTWQIAKQVLQQDARLEWHLLLHPNRLRITTIDAFCWQVVMQKPLLSQIIPGSQIATYPTQDYRAAIQYIFNSFIPELPWGGALKQLLLHLDNDWERTENLLINLLAERHQWLPYLIPLKNTLDARLYLTQALENLVDDIMQQISAHFPLEYQAECFTLLQYAIEMLATNDPSGLNPLLQCRNWVALPEFSVSNYANWCLLADWLLTKENEWRKRIDKNLGFPPADRAQSSLIQQQSIAMKKRMLQLLGQLSSNDALRLALVQLRLAPPPVYTETQWQMVSALMTLLPVLVAQLHLIQQASQRIDFVSLALGASQVLSEKQTAMLTSIETSSSQSLQHILVDEFQDTSAEQFRLLNQLLHDWHPGDGRTLFVVGDPMQSIYRFRQAEVGLFLQVVEYGVAHLRPQLVQLHCNFRAQAHLITWLNQHFAKIFPATADIARGAIPFCASVAILPAGLSPAVITHPLFDASDEQEAEAICELITCIQRTDPEASIAILVRAKSHFAAIVTILSQAKIIYCAQELTAFAKTPVITDLLMLTRALGEPANRLAWFSLLRAPWCGLDLLDLEILAQYPDELIITTLQRVFDVLSMDAQGRLKRILPILQVALYQAERIPWAQLVRDTWRGLGGAACVNSPDDFELVEQYFALLATFTKAQAPYLDWDQFAEELTAVTAQLPDNSHAKIHIMTIHKAKGLEFDYVILPGLARSTRQHQAPLLRFIERPRAQSEGLDLILAPIKQSHSDEDPIYRYLSALDAEKSALELRRLLYVAVTRPKKQLHLFGTVTQNSAKDQIKIPAKNSLLFVLWPLVAADFEAAYTKRAIGDLLTAKVATQPEKNLMRLSGDWQSPLIPSIYPIPTAENLPPAFSVTQHLDAHLGSAIHLLLQTIADVGLTTWDNYSGEQKAIRARNVLSLFGITPQNYPNALSLMQQAIKITCEDLKGRWILSNHFDAKNEYRLSLVTQNKIKPIWQGTIDRTFIADNKRYIIDYKTSIVPKECASSEFLAAEQVCHTPQLEQYGHVLQLREPNIPIVLGLYYPLFAGWIEWTYIQQ